VASETVVVGAGPAGLAVAGSLAALGHHATVLERADSIGSAWSGRYDSLRLHTVRWLSGLPGRPIPRRYGRWVARDDLVAYLEDYARDSAIVPEFGVEVTGLTRADGHWVVHTSAGERPADAVVLATGVSGTPYLPAWPGRETFPGPISHSVSYREPSSYRGGDVLVVGSGNSATEIATELSGVAARVRLAVRTPPNIIRRDTLGVPSQLLGVALRGLPATVMDPLSSALRRLTVPDLTGYGLPAPPGDGFSQFLRSKTVPVLDHGFVDAVRSGRIVVVPAVVAVDGPEVRLVDGTTVRPDAVIAATGYRPGLDRLVGGLGVLDPDGYPVVHGPRTAPAAPDLYFVGLTVELSGLLREIAREAGRVARRISARTAAAA
jgi:putative flavoprotein involved in K+ transport